MENQSNPDEVICPACVHQFRAIPESVQAELRRLHAENERLKSIARELFEANEAYGCGFYNDDRWLAAYNALRRNI